MAEIVAEMDANIEAEAAATILVAAEPEQQEEGEREADAATAAARAWAGHRARHDSVVCVLLCIFVYVNRWMN